MPASSDRWIASRYAHVWRGLLGDAWKSDVGTERKKHSLAGVAVLQGLARWWVR